MGTQSVQYPSSGSVSITPSKAAASDSSGNIVASTTTATELGYVSGVTSAIQSQIDAKIISTSSQEISNLGLAASVASSALTVALKQSDGSTNPSTGASAVKIGLRSSTATSGAYNQRSVTSALSVVVPSTATLGHVSGADAFIYVYALDNAGTVELAVSCRIYDDCTLQSTTAISAAATSTALYSTSARAGVPIRLIGRMKSNQVTAGTWASAPTEVSLNERSIAVPAPEYVYNTDTTNATNTSSFGYGSGGVQFASIATSSKTKRVQFPTPLTDGDVLTVEIFNAVHWAPLGQNSALVAVDSSNGIYLDDTGGGGPSFADVKFQINRTSGQSWAGIAGSATYKWRVVKTPRIL